jgi:hypothetical protein
MPTPSEALGDSGGIGGHFKSALDRFARMLPRRSKRTSKDIVLGKEAWVIVLAFIFVADNNLSRDIAEKISSFNRENFNIRAE